ncbi:MAG: hypothetical protein IPM79_04690 [Polyangiaceae bacterium]|jgi:hypothetical protein|nr:hypothetical protein [Polyangiaceae bacterium]MBK8936944.1 hypothetical protein [Polyangiaceae bacterium]
MNQTMKFVGGLLLAMGLLGACGDDTTATGGSGGGNGGENPGGNGTGGSGGGGGVEIPPKPELGAQIDRMGRPAINTALMGAFIQFSGAGNPQASDNTTRAELEDAYNADSDAAGWSAEYTTLFAANLAILDALDSGVPAGATPEDACENQAFSCGDYLDTSGCYDLLAGVLADDRLWVDTTGVGCNAAPVASPVEGYLAMELEILLNAPNDGCGGRRPVDDVIDITYSALTVGGVSGVGDGIPAPADLHPETFPFLAEPH